MSSSLLLHVAEGVGERQLTPRTKMSSPCGARAGRAKNVAHSPHTAQRRGCADTVQATALKVGSTGCSAYVDLTSGAAPSGAGEDEARLGRARRGRAHAEGARNTRQLIEARRCHSSVRRERREYGGGSSRRADTVSVAAAVSPTPAYSAYSADAQLTVFGTFALSSVLQQLRELS